MDNFDNNLPDSEELLSKLKKEDEKKKFKQEKSSNFLSYSSSIKQYSIVITLVVITTAICFIIRDIIGYQVVSFVLLFLVSILAIFFGTGPILVAAVLSALIWDVFFIPPQFTIHIENPLDLLMLIMFFIIALVNGIFTSRYRRQEQKIRIREERTNALYQLTKDLASVSGFDEVNEIAAGYIQKYFKIDCTIFIKNELNKLEIQTKSDKIQLDENEINLAHWVFRHSIRAGKFTNTQSSSEYTFYPLQGNSGSMGIVVIKNKETFSQDEEQFLEACLSQITGKYEREFLREEARKTYLISESEKLYKTLFNSISHELRIPVAAIMGASDTLLSQEYPQEIKSKLLNEINTASIRLNRLIENLLNMSRLEYGRINPHTDWCDVNDLANEVYESLKNELIPFVYKVDLPPNMPLVYLDYGLIEQVLHNLLLNATQYSPDGSEILLKFLCNRGILTIQVKDCGSGFPESELSSVFKKFYRGKDSKTGGTGLGLSIVKGFVEAHKGTVIAENDKSGGALITINIPVEISDANENNIIENQNKMNK